MVDRLWPKVEPGTVVLRLLSDPATLAAAADGVLTDDEQALLLWPTPPRGPGSARWSLADAVLVDEAADLVDREPSLGHVVLDEAQDLSPMQLRAVGRRCSTGAATVLGDIAQGTTPWATTDWAATLTHLGKPAARVEVLARGYRVPALVIDFASRLLPFIAPDVAAPLSVRENPGLLEIVPSADLGAAVVRAATEALGREGSIGLIVADGDVAATTRRLRATACRTSCSATTARPSGSPSSRRRSPRASSSTTSSWSSRPRSSTASRRRRWDCAGSTSC